VDESMTCTTPGRTIGHKVRTLAIGALATVALAVPALSAVSVVGHEAWGRSPEFRQGPGISPDSHRLALSLKPASVRLT